MTRFVMVMAASGRRCDPFLASIFLKMAGSRPFRSSSEENGPRLLRYSSTARLSRRSSCSTLSRSIASAVFMSRGRTVSPLKCVGKVFENRRKILFRPVGAEGLHAIDRLDPSFARELDGRRLRRFVAGAAQPERLFLARAVRQRILREPQVRRVRMQRPTARR